MAVIGAIIVAHEHPVASVPARIDNTAHAMAIGFMLAAAVFAATLVSAWFLLPRRQPEPAASLPVAA